MYVHSEVEFCAFASQAETNKLVCLSKPCSSKVAGLYIQDIYICLSFTWWNRALFLSVLPSFVELIASSVWRYDVKFDKCVKDAGCYIFYRLDCNLVFSFIIKIWKTEGFSKIEAVMSFWYSARCSCKNNRALWNKYPTGIRYSFIHLFKSFFEHWTTWEQTFIKKSMELIRTKTSYEPKQISNRSN